MPSARQKYREKMKSGERSRRKFLADLGLGAAVACLSFPEAIEADVGTSPFRVAVINDEISQDFGRACEVAAKEFGMHWIELRGMWNKNIVNLDSKEILETQRILKKYGLKVTDIASPLFKVDWPDAPKSKFSPASPQFGADFSYAQQDEVLDRSMELAKRFETNRVRCFDFWRLENPKPFRRAMNERLATAAERAGKNRIILVLENEPACNTATGHEASVVLHAVKTPHLMLNWDPGNAAELGEVPYPDGFDVLPKERIGHCHCKDARRLPDGKYEWTAMGSGIIDWVGQFRALKNMGYRFAVSLETHWRGATTPEESTRQSWAGMKEALESAGAS